MSIGENLKKFRNQKKVSQRKLAASAGVSFAYIQQLEKNEKTNPGIEILSKLSAALDVPLYELLGEERKSALDEAYTYQTFGDFYTDETEIDKGKNLLEYFKNERDGLDELPHDMVSYMQFIKLLETLGYKSSELKIDTLNLFNKVKYQIELEIKFSEKNK